MGVSDRKKVWHDLKLPLYVVGFFRGVRYTDINHLHHENILLFFTSTSENKLHPVQLPLKHAGVRA